MSVAEIARRCKEALEAHRGSRLKGLVVYGSVARNQAAPASDVDLPVLLSRPFDHFHELRRIVDLLYPIQLESNRLISARPAPSDEFEQGTIQLYRDAKRERVLV